MPAWPETYRSHTTPSPSPSRALGTSDLGDPLVLPLLRCTRGSSAACAGSHGLYDGACGVGWMALVGRSGRRGLQGSS